MELITNNAAVLDQAALNAKATSQLSVLKSFTLVDAYEIQKKSIQHRIDRGENIIGYKLGFTSKAKMEQMGVHDIIWGHLTDQMQIGLKGTMRFEKFIHPRVEPEIAFRLKKDITSTIQLSEVLEYIDGVAGALEIIDSRYENFKFSLEDVVADNCSSSGFVLGKWHEPSTSVKNIAIEMTINGSPVQNGNSDAILGNPYESLVEASKMMERYNQKIEAGQFILAGAATSAEYLKKNDSILASFGVLGDVDFKVS